MSETFLNDFKALSRLDVSHDAPKNIVIFPHVKLSNGFGVVANRVTKSPLDDPYKEQPRSA